MKISELDITADQAVEIVQELHPLFYDKDGLTVPVPAGVIKSIDPQKLRLFNHVTGMYGMITTELVDFLRDYIGDRTAIEIGAGLGTLGRALKIPRTDNKMQNWPEIQISYQMTRQPTIVYPSDVEELDAIAAIEKYKPDVVIGSYITHKYKAAQHHMGGNMYAPDEIAISKLASEYIMLGNMDVHSHNRLIKNKKINVRILQTNWIIGRNAEPKKDCLYFFQRVG